jgi:hypothetical protein
MEEIENLEWFLSKLVTGNLTVLPDLPCCCPVLTGFV